MLKLTIAFNFLLDMFYCRLIDMIAEYFDSSTAHAIKLVDVERLPLLLVANKIRSTFDNISMIQGKISSLCFNFFFLLIFSIKKL